MAKEKIERTPQVLPGQAHGPAVVIARRAADRLRAGHLWMYRSDVESLIPREGDAEIAAGALVTVADSRGIPLGSGLYSSASQIAVRMVSGEAKLTREAYLSEVRERLEAALTLRAEFAPVSGTNDSCRLVFAEADGLAGNRGGPLQRSCDPAASDPGNGAGGSSRGAGGGFRANTSVARSRRSSSGPTRRFASWRSWRRLQTEPLYARSRGKADDGLHDQRNALPLRRLGRPEDGSVSRSACELCRCRSSRAWRGTRYLHLSGRLCAASGPDAAIG